MQPCDSTFCTQSGSCRYCTYPQLGFHSVVIKLDLSCVTVASYRGDLGLRQ